MEKILTKIFALALTASLLIAPVAFAQEASADASSTDVVVTTPDATDTKSQVFNSSVPADPASSSTPIGSAASSTPADAVLNQLAENQAPNQIVEVQGSTESVQDTANTQPAVSGEVLENTSNPETATSTGVTSIPLTDIGTSTPQSQLVDSAQSTSSDVTMPLDEGTSSLDIVAENVDTSLAPDSAPTNPAVVQKALAVVPIEDVTPKPEYTFALTGKHIPSKRHMKSPDGISDTQQTVTAPLVPKLDNTTGTVQISGQCSDAYFVVLLFKNQDDYANDPRSYIVNRAYPCSGGSFSYSISDLPGTLPDGAYYLLVGQEGERGTWTPITSLTEITINRNQ